MSGICWILVKYSRNKPRIRSLLDGKNLSQQDSDLFQYDEVGNMTAATNSYIAYYYGYDAVNRVTGVTSYNLSKIFNIDYQYDIMGKQKSDDGH